MRTPLRPRLLLPLVLLFPWLLLPWAAGDATAKADSPELKAVRAEFHGRLLELASWCTSRKLFGTRHDLYVAILESWPDDEVARKWNGFKRSPDGGWLPSRKKRPGLAAPVRIERAIRDGSKGLRMPSILCKGRAVDVQSAATPAASSRSDDPTTLKTRY